jgi:uncharacterized protein (DUF2249 family)
MKSTPTNAPVLDAGKVLDVRSIPCSIKHGLIIKQWLDTPVNDHFILLNNHDPVPLYYQFAAQWPGAFTWEQVVKGPEEVRVKITKWMAVGPAAEVAECSGEH